MNRAGLGREELLRVVSRHRGALAGLLATAAAAAALGVVAPSSEQGVAVLAAARDVPAGSVLVAEDVEVVRLPRRAVPDGAVVSAEDAVGRAVAGAVRAGEALTDVRLVGAGLLLGLPSGTTAVAVRLADAGAARLLRAGDVVDVLAAPTSGSEVGEAVVVAAEVSVLAVPEPDPDSVASALDGALVVVAAPRATAAALASAAVTSRLSVALRAAT